MTEENTNERTPGTKVTAEKALTYLAIMTTVSAIISPLVAGPLLSTIIVGSATLILPPALTFLLARRSRWEPLAAHRLGVAVVATLLSAAFGMMVLVVPSTRAWLAQRAGVASPPNLEVADIVLTSMVSDPDARAKTHRVEVSVRNSDPFGATVRRLSLEVSSNGGGWMCSPVQYVLEGTKLSGDSPDFRVSARAARPEDGSSANRGAVPSVKAEGRLAVRCDGQTFNLEFDASADLAGTATSRITVEFPSEVPVSTACSYKQKPARSGTCSQGRLKQSLVQRVATMVKVKGVYGRHGSQVFEGCEQLGRRGWVDCILPR
jgi:hypothetical protein